MEEQTLQPIKSKIEALLFTYGEALGSDRIAKGIGITHEQACEALESLMREYETHPERGICLMKHDELYQLGTKPGHYTLLDTFVKQDFQQDLSPASLEALSIVLYRGPISRAQIDAIRGVNSSFILRNLLLRGLIERMQDTKGHHIFLYKPTMALLQLLGVPSREMMPDYQTLSTQCDTLLAQSEVDEMQHNEEAAGERGIGKQDV